MILAGWKLCYPKTAKFSLLIAWVTLTIDVHAILAQHALPSWALASLFGTLMAAVSVVVLSNLELPQKFFARRTDHLWVFIIMPIIVFLLCHGAMQLVWMVAPFLHAS